MSGGVDSSLIACILRELYPKIEINTFNLGYQGNSVDQGKQLDSKMARYISKKIKSRHHQILIDPENLSESLNSIIKCYGEPFSAAPSMWFVAKEISKFSKPTTFLHFWQHFLNSKNISRLQSENNASIRSGKPDKKYLKLNYWEYFFE